MKQAKEETVPTSPTDAKPYPGETPQAYADRLKKLQAGAAKVEGYRLALTGKK